ncbi:hypothetical protein DRQ27_01815 [bacterium]|nr:MAG: hypothetical protein DRQ27_01815 [bacterium]
MKVLWKQLGIGIIGAGRIGANLAYWLSKAGWRIKGVISKNNESAAKVAKLIPTGVYNSLTQLLQKCDVAIIAVPDRVIFDILEEICDYERTKVKTIIHTAGVLPATIIKLAGLDYAYASLHPMASISGLDTKKNPFANIFFDIDGDDFGVSLASELAKSLGGEPVIISSDSKALCHCADVFAANFVFACADVALKFFSKAGISEPVARKMVKGLVESALKNLFALGSPEGLTGPAKRGDINTILIHSFAIEDEELRAVYDAFTDYLFRLSRGESRIPRENTDTAGENGYR